MSQDKTVFPLISINQFPTVPAIWSSSDPGELWIWGDYFFTLQKEPCTAQQLLAKQLDKEELDSTMLYHYVMTAFYQVHKNPHGPSQRPIMVIGIEQMNNEKVIQMMGDKLDSATLNDLSASKLGPLYLGLFTGDAHHNLGKYKGELERVMTRETFFQVLAALLGLTGEPKYIGVMQEAFGHPQTGLPRKEQN